MNIHMLPTHFVFSSDYTSQSEEVYYTKELLSIVKDLTVIYCFSFAFFLFLLIAPARTRTLPVVIQITAAEEPVTGTFFPTVLITVRLADPSPSFVVRLTSDSFQFPLINYLICADVSSFFNPFSVFPSPFTYAFLSFGKLAFIFNTIGSVSRRYPAGASVSFR